MSKKNKKGKNNQAALNQNSNAKKQELINNYLGNMPEIKVVEYETSEEGKKALEDAQAKADEYYNDKVKAADEYYENKKKEADEILETSELTISEEKEKAKVDAEKEIRKKLKEETDAILNEAKASAQSLRESAEKFDKDTRADLEKLNKELTKNQEQYVKDKRILEDEKLTYKNEILENTKSLMGLDVENFNKLEEDKIQLEKLLKEKDRLLSDDKEDINVYKKQLEAVNVRKSELEIKNLEIERLNKRIESLNDTYKELDEKFKGLESQIMAYGDDPQKAMNENAKLIEEIKKLKNLMADCPSEDELEKLREARTQVETLNNKINILTDEKNKLEVENIELKSNKDEISSYRRFIKILELQKTELQKELDRNIELYSTTAEKVFANLSEIDKQENKEIPDRPRNSEFNLKTFCDRFRNYLASRTENKLYYDETTIRTFVAGFASSRLTILEGLSGTGKSSLPRAFMDFTGATNIEVPVQSSWKDRNDLLGFYNDFKKQYKETQFLQALYQATHDPNNIYLITLDEMNLSRIEYYFADLLSVLEKPNVEDWKIELISDYMSITPNANAWPKLIKKGCLQVCNNTWFIGTANKDDSTSIITDKVYDRSVVINFDKRCEEFTPMNCGTMLINRSDFADLIDPNRYHMTSENQSRFNSIINFLDEYLLANFEITFGNRIKNQLDDFVPVYIACGGTVDEAIDVMFSRKILRKLEGLYDENTKEGLKELKEMLDNKNYKMPKSISAINKMIDRI